ncbi:IS1/IS1595 family N-terminal zinc-binding domain-containing protein [Pyrococcus yayanosii]
MRIGYLKRDELKVRRFKCKRCGRTFTELEGTPLKGVHSLKNAVLVAYFKLELKVSDSLTAKVLEIPQSTIKRLSKNIHQHKKFFKTLLRILLDE